VPYVAMRRCDGDDETLKTAAHTCSYSEPCTRQHCTTNWDAIRDTPCITECTITNVVVVAAAAAAAADDDDDEDEDAYKRCQLERCSN